MDKFDYIKVSSPNSLGNILSVLSSFGDDPENSSYMIVCRLSKSRFTSVCTFVSESSALSTCRRFNELYAPMKFEVLPKLLF